MIFGRFAWSIAAILELTNGVWIDSFWSCSRSANLGRTCSIGRLLDTQGGRYLKPRPPGRYIKHRPPPRNAVAAARRGSPERRRVPPAAVSIPCSWSWTPLHWRRRACRWMLVAGGRACGRLSLLCRRRLRRAGVQWQFFSSPLLHVATGCSDSVWSFIHHTSCYD